MTPIKPPNRHPNQTALIQHTHRLGFFGGGGRGGAMPMVTSSEIYRRPLPVMGGQFQVRRGKPGGAGGGVAWRVLSHVCVDVGGG